MKYKFVLVYEWNFRGPESEHFEHVTIQPYSKDIKEYIGYNCIGGAGADGVEVHGYRTLKECFNNINLEYLHEVKYFNFNNKQKRRLNKVISQLKKDIQKRKNNV